MGSATMRDGDISSDYISGIIFLALRISGDVIIFMVTW